MVCTNARCRHGADPPRDGGDAPWTTRVIKAIIKCSTEMQNDSARSWEFRGLARHAQPGFATADGCWVFAEADGRLRSVAPQAGDDTYLAVRHPSSDPVMEANERWVTKLPAHDVIR